MSFLLSDLQTQIAYKLNETSAPTTTSEDYIQRLGFVNEGLRQWAIRSYWNILRVYDSSLSTTPSQAYIVLPTNFTPNSLSGKVYITSAAGADDEYTVVSYQDKNAYDASAKIMWTSYDPTSNRWRLYIQPTPTAALTIKYQYKYSPTNISNDIPGTSDVIIIPNPDWLVNYVVACVRDSRDENAVALNIKQENEQIMQDMIDTDQHTHSNVLNKVKTTFNKVGRGYGI